VDGALWLGGGRHQLPVLGYTNKPPTAHLANPVPN
jgi:hypothetical protein